MPEPLTGGPGPVQRRAEAATGLERNCAGTIREMDTAAQYRFSFSQLAGRHRL